MPGLASLSKSLISRLGERRAQVCLRELDEEDKPASDYLAFQYFPETIEDRKAVNYAHKDIPGGSLPLYQWTSSGERIISFEAIFTADVDLAVDTQAFAQLVSKGQVRRNVDIRTALLWLRRYMLPRYAQAEQLGVPLTLAPRKLQLFIPNSGIGVTGGLDITTQTVERGTSVGSEAFITESFTINSENFTGMHYVNAIMQSCDITYEAFFPSGLPRIATVNLQFAQIAQMQGRVVFPSTNRRLDNLVNLGSEADGFAPYLIKVKIK